MALCIDPAILGVGIGAIDIMGKVLQDPALPEFVMVVSEIADLSTGPNGSNPGAPGVGLDGFITPLKGYLFTQQHPVLSALLGVGVLALPFAIGFAVGRR